MRTCVLADLRTAEWVNCRPRPHITQCSPMTVVSANRSIRFVPIFEGVPWRGGVKQQGGNRKHRFHGFRRMSSAALEIRPKLLYSNIWLVLA